MCPSRTILIICATFLLPNDAFVQHPKLPRSSSSLYAKKAAKKKAPTAGGKGFSASTAKAEVNRLPKEESDPCGCGSGSSYADCCSKFHNGAPRETAEQVLRSRFTAYQYRLPSFLVSSTLKFAPPSKEEAVLSNANAKNKVAVKEEKTELLKFCDSYEFSDLEIGETSQNDDSHNIAFTCKLKARAARIDFGEETSDFLENNVVDFKETSSFVQLGGTWYYDSAVEVDYEGESLADRFDTESRREALEKSRAERAAKTKKVVDADVSA